MQDNMHDFAWFADKAFLVRMIRLQLTSKTIDVYAYYNTENMKPFGKTALNILNLPLRTKSELAW